MQQRSSMTITPPTRSTSLPRRGEVHLRVDVVGREHRRRRAARDDRLQRPPARDAAADVVDQLPHRDPVRKLVVAGVRDVAREREDARARRVLDAELRVLRAAHLEHRRHGRDRLDVVHRCRCGVEARDRGERRLRRGCPLAFERLEERGLLAADVCTRATVETTVTPPRRSAARIASSESRRTSNSRSYSPRM